MNVKQNRHKFEDISPSFLSLAKTLILQLKLTRKKNSPGKEIKGNVVDEKFKICHRS